MQKKTWMWLLWAALLALMPASLYLTGFGQHEKPKPSDGVGSAAQDSRALSNVRLPAVALPGFGMKEYSSSKPYHYRFNWFAQNIGVWENALAAFKGRPGVRYLEVGMFEGMSAFWMLDNILTHPTARLTGIDPFLDSFREGFKAIFFANLEVSGNADRTSIITGFSQVEMRKLPLDSFDIIYIDGSHRAPDVLEDAVLAHRLLKANGVLIFDDYLWDLDQPPLEAPKLAIDTFYLHYGNQYDVVHNQYQVILRKRKEASGVERVPE